MALCTVHKWDNTPKVPSKGRNSSLLRVLLGAPPPSFGRLLGFITIAAGEGPPTYRCHIFEVHTSAEEVCNALSVAANIALKALMGQQQEQQQEAQAQKEEEKQSEELLQKLKLSADENALFPTADKTPADASQAKDDAETA